MAMLKQSMRSLQAVHQRGLSLIEVLIALLVLSIGMVGLGALLLISLTNVHSSSHFSLASAMALDLEERLWFEVAHRSATNPASLVDGCLSGNQVETVVIAMRNQWAQEANGWNWTDSTRLRVPELAIAFQNVAPTQSANNTAIRWKIVPVTIQWRESRFEDLDDELDVFTADVTVPCRPTFNS